MRTVLHVPSTSLTKCGGPENVRPLFHNSGNAPHFLFHLLRTPVETPVFSSLIIEKRRGHARLILLNHSSLSLSLSLPLSPSLINHRNSHLKNALFLIETVSHGRSTTVQGAHKKQPP